MPSLPSGFHLGTVGWSYRDWIGVFYPAGTRQADMLLHYVKRFSVVEVDSTFYGTPQLRAVESWRRKAPIGFRFCPKLPQEISHRKFLVDVEEELDTFVSRMSRLGPGLGPMVLQFPYFRLDSGVGLDAFVDRLGPFLELFRTRAGPEGRLVVEVRNKRFHAPPLLDLLRRHRVALCILDHPYMPAPDEILDRRDLVTADFSYVRLLGDRQIESITSTWNRLVLDQRWRLDCWADWIRSTLARVDVYAFANNYFAGFAPATASALRDRIAGNVSA